MPAESRTPGLSLIFSPLVPVWLLLLAADLIFCHPACLLAACCLLLLFAGYSSPLTIALTSKLKRTLILPLALMQAKKKRFSTMCKCWLNCNFKTNQINVFGLNRPVVIEFIDRVRLMLAEKPVQEKPQETLCGMIQGNNYDKIWECSPNGVQEKRLAPSQFEVCCLAFHAQVSECKHN